MDEIQIIDLHHLHTVPTDEIKAEWFESLIARWNKRHETFEQNTLVHAAFRYYLGRQTIAMHSFIDELCANWLTLSRATRTMIGRELEEAFERDERDRKEHRAFHPLGMDCDKQAWTKLRKLSSDNCLDCNMVKHQCLCSHTD